MKKLIIKGMGERYFSDKIVKWYLENRRLLPWRDTKDAYFIWLSEVILQQTRVTQGLPYYLRFVAAYPTVSHLAKANQQDLLRLWQGLGYYTRARNLHKCAQILTERYHGQFPSTYNKLRELPGIGDYTAAAIASFAFDEPVAVVDGNVFRVLSRIFGIETIINTPEGKREFTALANQLIPQHQPAVFNQAVMEFGAMHCTPHNPKCLDCPFKATCFAFTNDLIQQLPVKAKAKRARIRYFFYLVIEKKNSLLMKKRCEKDIWNGLFDFYLIEKRKPFKAENLLMQKELAVFFKKASSVTISKKYKHILTHQTILCRFISIKTSETSTFEENGHSFYTPREINELPKPVLISRFLNDQNPL